MTLVEPSEQDAATAREILTAEVLPDWADCAGAEWMTRWTDSIGAAVGVTIAQQIVGWLWFALTATMLTLTSIAWLAGHRRDALENAIGVGEFYSAFPLLRSLGQVVWS